MTRRFGFGRGIGLLLMASFAVAMFVVTVPTSAQVGPWREPSGQPPRTTATQPDQPVNPATPTLERRIAPPTTPAAPAAPPFVLSPQQQAEVDRVLDLWEKRSAAVRTFECRFKRWEYDPTFGPADKPRFEDLGILKYAAPDRGAFQITHTVVNGKEQEIEPNRAEHWICDGKVISEYQPQGKVVNQFPLPPQLQGKAIANSPLPFLFGSKADDLKKRYFVCLITPAELQGQQTWILAYPRFQADAANFKEAQLILTNQNMQPYAMKILAPNGKNKTSYQFFETVINDPLRFFKGDPFQATVPFGWQKVVNTPPPAPQQPNPPQSANRPQAPGTR